MKLLLFLLFLGVLYWSFFYLPGRVSRGRIMGGAALGMLALLGLAALLSAYPALPALAGQALGLLLLALLVTFFNQLSHWMADSQQAWHEEHNATNLHRFPLSFTTRYHEQLKLASSGFWLLGSTLIAYGLLFRGGI